MRKSTCLLGWGVTVILLGQPGVVWSQEADRSESPRMSGDSEAEGDSKKISKDDQSAALHRLVSRLSKLRTYMNDKLDLDTKQKRVIHELFDEHMRALKKGQENKSASRLSDDQKQRLEELKREIDTARGDGDQDYVKELRAELRGILRERQTLLGDATQKFVQQLERELYEEQIPEFKKLLIRLGFSGAPTQAGRESMGNLLHAVMDPSVGLSQEKRQAVIEIMRETVLSLDPEMDRDAFVAEIAARLQTEILGVLDEEEWNKVESLMAKSEGGDKNAQEGGTP